MQQKENRHIDIPLTGLVASTPIGAMAAFGLLRICAAIPELRLARLGWQDEDGDGAPLDDWIAVLRVPVINIKPDQKAHDWLIQKLTDFIVKRCDEDYEWPPQEQNKDIRVPSDEYRWWMIRHAMTASAHNRILADWITAFCSDVVTDKTKKQLVKPTAFYMVSGQQKFLKIISEIRESLHHNADSALQEALFGPWRYQDKFHSLGWDPASERLHALRHKAPSDEQPVSVRAAVWLAYESLPLFPTMRVGGRLKTVGFSQERTEEVLSWPIWKGFVSLNALRSLLAVRWDAVAGYSGLVGRYRARRVNLNQGYAMFRPAEYLSMLSVKPAWHLSIM